VWIREPGSGQPTHVRANSEPSPTEGPGEPSRTRPSPARGAPRTDEFGSLEPEPSWTRPSPARSAPHTDEFGSLEPEPSRTRESDSYVYGHLKTRHRLQCSAGNEEAGVNWQTHEAANHLQLMSRLRTSELPHCPQHTGSARHYRGPKRQTGGGTIFRATHCTHFLSPHSFF
jgi:hypothetical protein